MYDVLRRDQAFWLSSEVYDEIFPYFRQRPTFCMSYLWESSSLSPQEGLGVPSSRGVISRRRRRIAGGLGGYRRAEGAPPLTLVRIITIKTNKSARGFRIDGYNAN